MKTSPIKKSLLTSLLFFSSYFLVAQDISEGPELSYNHEWGLNVTSFANQFLSFNSNGVSSGPYLFTYKHHGKDKKDYNRKKVFRLGAGFSFNKTNTEGNNNVAPLESDQVNLSLRLGSERHFPIERRWLFTAGGDFLVNYSDNNSNSFSQFGDVSIDSNQWSVGVGPVVGVHFYINPRISLGTEGTIYLSYFQSKQKTDFGNFMAEPDSNKASGFNMVMNTPLALYFAVRL